ncbi:MAG: hypothetical protein GX608_08975, partial [Lentisphaerae bacterium]|nr:hypothetical protein [Lentisphaerota bacterium]
TNLFLRSTSDGTPSFLNVDPLAEQLVSRVDVKDSDALLGAEVIAANSRDRGGNLNWKFLSIYPGEAITWTGGSNTAWSQAENWDLVRAPMDSDVIVIPGGCERYPEMDADRIVHVIDLRRGASLALNGWDLVVTNMLSVAGTLTASGTETVTLLKDADFTYGSFDALRSILILAGEEAQSLNLAGASFSKILVENSGAPMTFYGGFTATELRCEAPAGTRELVFEAGSTVILRDLVLQGSSANIALRSTTPGTPWRLAVSGYRSIQGVEVQDSDASPGLPITAILTANRGGNVNWIFDAEWSEWLGSYGTDFHVSSNWASGEVPGADSRVLVETGNPMVISTPVRLLDLTIGGGAAAAMVTANAALTVTENITLLTNGTLVLNRPSLIRNGLYIFGGGTLTHSSNNDTEVNKIDLVVHGDVGVEEGGSVNVLGKGYAVGKGPGTAGGGQGVAGASYGGRGAYYSSDTPGNCYGSFFAPTNLGSGGGYSAGGGAIIIAASGTICIDGLFIADGAQAQHYQGSGGSVFLTAGALAGLGRISANGGDMTGSAAAAGGGRVSLVITNMGAEFSAFLGTIEARSTVLLPACSSAVGGGAGTIYFKCWSDHPGRGMVLVDNKNLSSSGVADVPPSVNYVPGEADFAPFHITNGAGLRLVSDFMVGDIRLGTANSYLDLNFKTLTVRSREHPLSPGTAQNFGQIIWLPDIPKGTIYFAK